jgi:lysophospholipid acyltransferase (LPLAT)-like uncharacterized protein
MPFTKALFLYGAPIFVPREADVEEERTQVERAMHELERAADERFDELWRNQKPETRNQT